MIGNDQEIIKRLDENSITLAVILEKIGNSNEKVVEIKKDLYLVFEKMNNLSGNIITNNDKIIEIRSDVIAIENKLSDIVNKHYALESKYKTVMNVIKFSLMMLCSFVLYYIFL